MRCMLHEYGYDWQVTGYQPKVSSGTRLRCALIIHDRQTQGSGGSHPWAVVSVRSRKKGAIAQLSSGCWRCHERGDSCFLPFLKANSRFSEPGLTSSGNSGVYEVVPGYNQT
eukprot:164474-Pyramimonas_sp.AAC.1